MRSIESLLGMPILSADEGSRLGTLSGVEISPEEQRVIYLCVDPSGKFHRGVIAWSDLAKVGTDALLARTSGTKRSPMARRQSGPSAAMRASSRTMLCPPAKLPIGQRRHTSVSRRCDGSRSGLASADEPSARWSDRAGRQWRGGEGRGGGRREW